MAALVLLVEVGEVDDEVLDDEHVGERGDHRGCRGVGVDGLQTSHGVVAVDVHGAGAADAFPARPPVPQAGILLRFDLLKHVQYPRQMLHPVHVEDPVLLLLTMGPQVRRSTKKDWRKGLRRGSSGFHL